MLFSSRSLWLPLYTKFLVKLVERSFWCMLCSLWLAEPPDDKRLWSKYFRRFWHKISNGVVVNPLPKKHGTPNSACEFSYWRLKSLWTFARKAYSILFQDMLLTKNTFGAVVLEFFCGWRMVLHLPLHGIIELPVHKVGAPPFWLRVGTEADWSSAILLILLVPVTLIDNQTSYQLHMFVCVWLIIHFIPQLDALPLHCQIL